MDIFLTNKERRSVNGRGELSGAELVYLVTGIPDGTSDEEILRQVARTSPAWQGYAPRSSAEISLRPETRTCEVTVRYRADTDRDNSVPRECKRAGDEIWTFSAGSTRERCFHSLHTEKYGNAAPNPGSWIRWNGGSGGDFHAAGAEKTVLSMREKCVRTFDVNQLTSSYKRTVMELIGHTNSAAFHSWKAGEVLFLEATQSPEFCNERGNWLADVTFVFAVAMQSASGTVSIPPWHVYWEMPGIARSGDAAVSGRYVSRIYPEGNFSRLNLARSDSAAALRERLRDPDRE